MSLGSERFAATKKRSFPVWDKNSYNGQMKTASISTAKNQLSALLEQVRHGETILITDHDRPVARLVPVGAENDGPGANELGLLERKGILRRGHGGACRLASPLMPAERASAVRALLEERESAR